MPQHPTSKPGALSRAAQRPPLARLGELHIASRRDELVRGVDLEVHPGERVALLGASGSGKSLTASALLGTLHRALRATGRLELDGRPVPLEAGIRSRTGLAAVMQDSRAALNPMVTIGAQVGNAARRAGASRDEASNRTHELLRQLGFDDAERIAHSHSGELSGGQRQRACIAVALATRPRLLVADEPTTALDALSQADVVAALRRANDADPTLGLLFITHDIAVAAQLCDRALVMAAGQVVETARMRELLRHPRHDYTRLLVASARVEARARRGERIEVAA